MLRVLDLFSGIGGFSLGLERTGGFETVAFCENDPECRAVLRKHWPQTPIHDDIRTLTGAEVGHVDLVCGGFPCQPFSTASAGKRGGQGDDRFLWPEMFRLVEELRPSWVLGENVIGIDGMALDKVVSDLEACGYEVAPPLEIPACALGYDHWRPRYWFLGYADRDREPELRLNAEVAVLPGRGSDTGSPRGEDGLPKGLDSQRRKQIGNAVSPDVVEMIGRAILAAEDARGEQVDPS